MTNGAGGADLPSFGSMLRRQRRADGLTQEELAELAGISPRELGAIETDAVRRPQRPTVERLASALQLSRVDRERFVAVARGRPLPPAAGEVRRRQPPAQVPAQLPADVAAFTGRTGELAALDELLVRGADGGSAVVISAVSGTAGVGKTALAVRWAHRMKNQFPDGQLYVNLRGYDPDQPVPPGAALAGFLRALGVPNSEIPLEVEERAAAYRTLLDGRRMLVVLDNAASAEQVRPLLPGSAGCLAVVTSRDCPGRAGRPGRRAPHRGGSAAARGRGGPAAGADRRAGGRRAGGRGGPGRLLRAAAAGAADRGRTGRLPTRHVPDRPGGRAVCRTAAGWPGSTPAGTRAPRSRRCSPGRCGTWPAARCGPSTCSACIRAPTTTSTPPRPCSAARWRRPSAIWTPCTART